MYWARLRAFGVFMGLWLLSVILAPVMIVCFFFYLMWLAFWPESKEPKTVKPFDGFEGWHV